MKPELLLRQLWAGHRWPLMAVGLLVLGNIVLVPALRFSLVPAVNQREEMLIRRQAQLRDDGTGGSSPVQQFVQGEKDLAAFRERIPPHREFTGLLLELQELADHAGLDLARISYRHEQDSDNQLLRYQLSFTLAGSYRDVKQFVHALEQSPRLFILQQVGLQGVEQEGWTDVRLQLDLETFFRHGAS